jgi:hypothetical protein
MHHVCTDSVSSKLDYDIRISTIASDAACAMCTLLQYWRRSLYTHSQITRQFTYLCVPFSRVLGNLCFYLILSVKRSDYLLRTYVILNAIFWDSKNIYKYLNLTTNVLNVWFILTDNEVMLYRIVDTSYYNFYFKIITWCVITVAQHLITTAFVPELYHKYTNKLS